MGSGVLATPKRGGPAAPSSVCGKPQTAEGRRRAPVATTEAPGGSGDPGGKGGQQQAFAMGSFGIGAREAPTPGAAVAGGRDNVAASASGSNLAALGNVTAGGAALGSATAASGGTSGSAAYSTFLGSVFEEELAGTGTGVGGWPWSAAPNSTHHGAQGIAAAVATQAGGATSWPAGWPPRRPSPTSDDLEDFLAVHLASGASGPMAVPQRPSGVPPQNAAVLAGRAPPRPANATCPFSHEPMDSASAVDLRCGHRFALDRLASARQGAQACCDAGLTRVGRDALICPLCGDQAGAAEPGSSRALTTYSANTDAYLGDLRKDWQRPLTLPAHYDPGTTSAVRSATAPAPSMMEAGRGHVAGGSARTASMSHAAVTGTRVATAPSTEFRGVSTGTGLSRGGAAAGGATSGGAGPSVLRTRGGGPGIGGGNSKQMSVLADIGSRMGTGKAFAGRSRDVSAGPLTARW